MTTRVPRLVVGGTHSGVGKTSLTLGLVRALARRGLAVQPFKVGPDYLDPTYLTRAAGRTCYNLDPWMTGEDYVRALLASRSAEADLAVIEGVMGLFDGADPDRSDGSTAHVADLIRAPVVLVVDAKGTARSACAQVAGYRAFDPGPRAERLGGFVANRCGSARHGAMIRAAAESAGLGDLWLGAVERGALPELGSRHLGLVTAARDAVPEATLDALADAVARALDLDRLLTLARTAPALEAPELPTPPTGRPQRLAVARDAAFHFYYPDNLEALERGGVEWVPVSPLEDRALPARLDGLYLGGGYPEEYGGALAANRSFRESVRAFAEAGGLVYAECGGLMYLARSLVATDGTRHPMAGVLPVSTRMLARRKTLGYAEAEAQGGGPWGPGRLTLRGHEFHYSEVEQVERPAGWQPAYRLRHRHGAAPCDEGFARGRVLASYLHAHFSSHPEALGRFLSRLEESP